MLQCANHNCQWSYLNQRLSVGRAYAAAIALPDSYAQCGWNKQWFFDLVSNR